MGSKLLQNELTGEINHVHIHSPRYTHAQPGTNVFEQGFLKGSEEKCIKKTTKKQIISVWCGNSSCWYGKGRKCKRSCCCLADAAGGRTGPRRAKSRWSAVMGYVWCQGQTPSHHIYTAVRIGCRQGRRPTTAWPYAASSSACERPANKLGPCDWPLHLLLPLAPQQLYHALVGSLYSWRLLMSNKCFS